MEAIYSSFSIHHFFIRVLWKSYNTYLVLSCIIKSSGVLITESIIKAFNVRFNRNDAFQLTNFIIKQQ